jgi:RNA exonuclease 4
MEDKSSKPTLQTSDYIIKHTFNPNPAMSKLETPVIALDCEMVEINGCSDGLARISVVNYNGHVLMDEYVRPPGRITNYRTWVSGIKSVHMLDATPFKEIIPRIHKLLGNGRIIVGHSL